GENDDTNDTRNETENNNENDKALVAAISVGLLLAAGNLIICIWIRRRKHDRQQQDTLPETPASDNSAASDDPYNYAEMDLQDSSENCTQQSTERKPIPIKECAMIRKLPESQQQII
ncbi:uncharacterized protein LOC132756008, partial [Ruditapes philippinarum]|uniref:uncharacterized protein LOC132756008 n=1 Tax=Ruditapes philippinarum TaxID=129788 RepID=UPI00295B30B6